MDQCTPLSPATIATCGFEFASPQAIGHTNPEHLGWCWQFGWQWQRQNMHASPRTLDFQFYHITGLSMQHCKSSGPASLVWN